MLNARQFQIDKKDGVLKTFFANDWMHGVFQNPFASDKQRTIAMILIGSQILVSSVGVMYSQAMNETGLAMGIFYCLLFSVMMLSNATKNQKDVFSSFMQSFCSKVTHSASMIVLAHATGEIFLTILAVLFTVDAICGLIVLAIVFDNNQEENSLFDCLDKEDKTKMRQFNDRVPELLQEDEVSQKLFTRGWKFNIFNEQKFTQKAITATVVILAQFYFAINTIIRSDIHRSYAVIVLMYSLICLFSFTNLSYVRDFDAIQVNFTPIVLSIAGILSIQKGFEVMVFGTVISCIADAYFAMRFQEDKDQIEYTSVEQFSLESWTQGVFNKFGRVELQIVSTVMIFMQIYFAMVGAEQKDYLSAIIMVFAMMRLVQFIFNDLLIIKMIQSNMFGLALAVMAIVSVLSRNAPTFTVISAALLVFDAVIGMTMFFHQNKEQISKELGLDIKQSGLNADSRVHIYA